MSDPNFLDYRLSDRVAMGFRSAPDFRTRQTQLKTTGIMLRNRQWMYPQIRAQSSYTMLHADAKREIREVLYVVCGAWLAFRFKDIFDFTATRQLIGIGDNTTTPMQLIKTYTKATRTFVRPIRLPLNPVIVDEDENVISATVASTTGLATPASPWPDGKKIYWSGEFDVPMHFERDYNPMQWDSPSTASTAIDLVEELAPLIAWTPEDN